MRDSKGRFLKGNQQGVRFSSDYQPANAGRKPSRFKQILESLDDVGEAISQEDYKKITAILLTMNADELTEIAQDKSSPIAVILIANAINGDLNNQRMNNFERLLDRIFGKATNSVDLTTKGESFKGIKVEVLDADIKDEIDKLG